MGSAKKQVLIFLPWSIGRLSTAASDILANAGGVTVSYFEWAQNIQQFKWDEERVNSELDKKMSRAYRSVRKVANERDIDMRTATFVLAIQRVGKATLARVHIKTELPF